MAADPKTAQLQHDAYVFDGLVTGPPSSSIVDRLLSANYDACNWTVAGRNDSTLGAMQKIVNFY